MPVYTKEFIEANLINPPEWLGGSLIMEAVVGSRAYGVSSDASGSDLDLVAVCVPPMGLVYPFAAGELPGFDKPYPRFEQFTQQRIPMHDCTADLSVYSIVRFVKLAVSGNPNVLGFLFSNPDLTDSISPVWDKLYAGRHEFLHRGCIAAFTELSDRECERFNTTKHIGNPQRRALASIHGYDTKGACNALRWLLELEQILTERNLEKARSGRLLTEIRSGKWSLADVNRAVADARSINNEWMKTTSLPEQPDMAAIKKLLIECLEMHYNQ